MKLSRETAKASDAVRQMANRVVKRARRGVCVLHEDFVRCASWDS